MNTKHLPLLTFLLFSANFCIAQDANLNAALAHYSKSFASFRNEIAIVQAEKITAMRSSGNTSIVDTDLYSTLADIDSKRDQRSGLLLYSYQYESLSIYYVTKDGLQAAVTKQISLDALYILEQELRKVIGVDLFPERSRSSRNTRGIDITDAEDAPTRSLETVINSVSQVLLPPEIDKNLNTCSHLYIIPCYNLYTIPFSCLYSNNQYLINTHSYTLVPSLYDWMEQAKVEVYNPMSNQYLSKSYSASVIGNPTYYKGADSLDKMFNDLPGAMMQTYVAATLFEEKGGDNLVYLTQQNASKSNVIQTIQKTRDMIYIATHGVVDMNNPLDESFLALAPDETSSTGFWTTREIMQTQLRSKVAVLSACNTGIGQNNAVGQFSLANSFYFAGVDNILVTLWSVDDAWTYKIMTDVIAQLTLPSSYYPAQNLQLVLNKYTTEHPKYWAPFICFGL